MNNSPNEDPAADDYDEMIDCHIRAMRSKDKRASTDDRNVTLERMTSVLGDMRMEIDNPENCECQELTEQCAPCVEKRQDDLYAYDTMVALARIFAGTQ